MAELVSRAQQILVALDEGAAEGNGDRPIRIEAIGWATVELDRAATELSGAFGVRGGGSFAPAAPDRLLGATARLARAGEGPPVVLLEPSTEGRLAAFLARHGEGVAAVYVSRPGGPVRGSASLASGPLGPQRWLAGERWGPWLVLVGAARQPPTAARPAVPSADERGPRTNPPSGAARRRGPHRPAADG